MEIKTFESIKIAFVGCLHGKLSDIYSELQNQEKKQHIKIDIVLICGDFQSLRSEQDYQYISVPDKYKELGQFFLYFNGMKTAPFLTIFIGGNHEASNVLDEFYYGGFLCENIFYLGRAGVVLYKGIRIAGISGIFKEFDYFKGNFEKNLSKDVKTIYHYREFDIARLSHLEKKIDIFLSHDWPNKVVRKEDFGKISKVKPHFRQELEQGILGSPPLQFLLDYLKPRFWVSAHLHYHYENLISHDDESKSYTQFIGLDKIIRNRTSYKIVDIFANNQSQQYDNQLHFDYEWMGITKTFNMHLSFENKQYDYSNFVRNSILYMSYIENYKFNKKIVVKPENFEDELNQSKFEFENRVTESNYEWKINKYKENKNFVLSILSMEDCYGLKFVPVKIKNQEELNVDFDF